MKKNQKRVINYEQLVINTVNDQNEFLSEISLYGHLFFDIRDKKYCFYYHGQNFPLIVTQSKKEIADFLIREFKNYIDDSYSNVVEIELIPNLSTLNKKLHQELDLNLFKLYILESSIDVIEIDIFDTVNHSKFSQIKSTSNYKINNFVPTKFLKLKFTPKLKSKYKINFSVHYTIKKNLLVRLNKMPIKHKDNILFKLQRKNNSFENITKLISLSFIEKFILYLVKEDYHIFYYVMHWLSCYFNTLNKSGTALVLFGNKELTKNIFWDKIITKIFGLKYCITIKGNECKSNSLFDIAQEKLFFHIEDIKNANTIFDDNTMSIIVKDLLVKSTITKLNKQREEESIDIYGQTLITTENPYPYIKRSMSRCTIIETNDLETILKKLSIQDEAMLEEMIDLNLYHFAEILRDFPYNDEYARYALNTDIRKKIIKDTQSNVNKVDIEEHINSFIQAIKDKDIDFFENVKSLDDGSIYSHLVSAFEDGYFIGQDLYKYYNAIFPNEFNSQKQLIDRLKLKDNMFKQIIDTLRISKPDGSNKKNLFSAYTTNKKTDSKKLYKIEGYKLPKDITIPSGYVIVSSQGKSNSIFNKYIYEDDIEVAKKLQVEYNKSI